MRIDRAKFPARGPFAGFRVLAADEFLSERSAVPDATGVYALFLSDAQLWLEMLGYAEPDRQIPVQGEHTHMYTGESLGIRSRVSDHLRGNVRVSNFRETILALVTARGFFGRLDQPIDPAACEEWLTGYLTGRVLVGFKLGGLVRDIERRILSATPSPLNIDGRTGSSYAKVLKACRRAFNARPEVKEHRSRACGPAYLAAGMISRRPRR